MKKSLLFKICLLVFSVCAIGMFSGCNACAKEEDLSEKENPTEYCQHEWKIVESKPGTCEEDGYTLSECGICGNQKRETENAGHVFVDGFCTRCDESVYSKGLTYSYDAYNEVYTLTGIGTCTDAVVKIPPKYQGSPVTKISNQAFANCDNITCVEIPDSITELGSGVFKNCTSLEEIELPTIGILPPNTFQNCSDLESVTLKEGLIEIGDYAFDGCVSLAEIELPSTVEELGGYVFREADTLTEITLPNTVESLGAYAFYKCDGLKTVNLSAALTKINDSTFELCTNLTSAVLPNGIRSIGQKAFSDCSSLLNIGLGDNVFQVGYRSFQFCSGAKTLKIGNGLSHFNESFVGVSGLDEITVDAGNAYFKSENNCLIERSTNKLVLGCKSSIIPNTVTTIGGFAFYNCKTLQSITIPNSVDIIERHAFQNCIGLQDLTVGNAVRSIGAYAFRGCTGIQTISLPNGLETISPHAFYECTSLRDLTLPDSLKSVGGNAFDNCTSLNYYTDGNLKYLGNSTNNYLYLRDTTTDSITSVNINAKCKFVDANAFHGCYSVQSLSISASVIEFNSAFRFFSTLKSLTLDSNNTVYKIDGNCIIKKADNSLAFGYKNSVIPTYVTNIGNFAFSDCAGLQNITIPNNVTGIGYYAFYNCSSLQSVNIGNSVTSIGENAFYNCKNLTSIEIPNSVTSIGYNVFGYCTSLQSITFNGTKAQWQRISKGTGWKEGVPATVVYCTDGNVAI